MKIVTAENQSPTQFNDIVQKAKNVANSWSMRSVTLIGKVLVVNTLISSLFVYHMLTLPMMMRMQVANIESIIKNYLWNSKHPKIPMHILQKDKNDGGLRLVNIVA